MSKVWRSLREQAHRLAGLNHTHQWNLEFRVLEHDSFEAALGANLGFALKQLGGDKLPAWITALLRSSPDLIKDSAADMERFIKDDPSLDHLVTLISSGGYQALQLYRIANMLWLDRDRHNTMLLKNWAAQVWGIDIHPGAMIGKGLVIKHGYGLVIEEGVKIEEQVTLWNNVSILRNPSASERCPVVKRGATVHANTLICGGVTVGKGVVVPEASIITEGLPG